MDGSTLPRDPAGPPGDSGEQAAFRARCRAWLAANRPAKPGFELPEEAYGLREYLITAIAAPSNDVAVGILYAEIGSEANNVVGAHREALSAVKISETYQYELKRLELARLYRCEELEPVFREIESRKRTT